MEACLGYITCGSREEAERIARALLEERLIACANILDGLLSLYRWQGELARDRETLLLVKTRRPLVEAVIRTVRAEHSYECPCITFLPLAAGDPDYLAWIDQETEGERSG